MFIDILIKEEMINGNLVKHGKIQYRYGKFKNTYIVYIAVKEDKTTDYGYLTREFYNKAEAIKYAKTTKARPRTEHEQWLHDMEYGV